MFLIVTVNDWKADDLRMQTESLQTPLTEVALVVLILRKAEATLMLIPSSQDRVQACGLETGT